MLFRYLVFYFLFNISLNLYVFISGEYLRPERGQKVLENVVNLTQSLLEITPYINLTLGEIPPNCIQMQCKFVCFNGKSTEIEEDILRVSEQNHHFCSEIEELQLYNYEFADHVLSFGFLGNFSDKVISLYLASANITDIEVGAFAKGKFKEIYFENLQLQELKKEFFQGISPEFNKLSIIQKEMPVQSVHSDFLFHIKYQIKYLIVQAGLKSVRNLTGVDILLNNLIYTDFSHNDFGIEMESSVFNKLSMIEHMDLSHSNLEYLPSYLFAEFTMTLEYLDLSYNKLKTISRTIFGWREMPRDLRIYAEGNAWLCTCDLHHEMKKIFVFNKMSFVCSEPEYYKGWSVLDEKICKATSPIAVEDDAENLNLISTTANNEQEFNGLITTPSSYDNDDKNILPPDLLKLNCLASLVNTSKRFTHRVQWPSIVFNVISQPNLQVEVLVDSLKKSYDSLGLLWFSKVTTTYYKMEINYKEYGLGCLDNISYATSIHNLSPNTAYTFCVVLKQRWTVSPFNCKSIYVSDNVAIKNNAWLTLNMRMAGLSLIFFGTIMFLFTGILMVYLILKHKPILIKGSKRVTTTLSNNGDIVVLPKKNSVRAMKEKEENLARHNSQQHRKSTESEASYQSYINTNTNLYEAIPSYKKPMHTTTSLEGEILAEIKKHNSENCYLTPLETMPNAEDLLQYAEIPYRGKCNSNDASPKVPADKPPLSEEPSKLQNNSEYLHVRKIYMLDSEV